MNISRLACMLGICQLSETSNGYQRIYSILSGKLGMKGFQDFGIFWILGALATPLPSPKTHVNSTIKNFY
jgi:hypothetical protein